MRRAWILLAGAALSATGATAQGVETPDARAARAERTMTDAERFQLLSSLLPHAIPGKWDDPELLARIPHVSAYIAGIPRFGIPEILATDASLGVANPNQVRKDKTTALPSGLAIAAAFDPALAREGGALIGAETRGLGYHILLAGGANLARDPRNGRNFEYYSEDPLLTGVLAGEAVRGIQSQGVLSTVKHFALNAQETLRHTLDARIDEAGFRESDLLAFQLAIERGQPGAVMCGYNLVNGAYACGNDHLLNTVLKRDWGYKGFVMSDWGAVHGTSDFTAGLDQQSGWQLDAQRWFDAPLRADVAAGKVTRARLSDAVRRILRSYYAADIASPRGAAVDYDRHAAAARRIAGEGIVLLKNDGALPLAAGAKSIAVIGGHAHVGVMSGGGSSQVTPVGGPAAIIPVGGSGLMWLFGKQLIVPSSPLQALRAALPKTQIGFNSGYYPEAAAAEAAKADVAIVFATQWQVEGMDAGSMTLPQGQDALIAAVAKANPNTIVVLETGNPVRMPWLGGVKAVVEAWYPGQRGGEAIADVLTGKVNPSGRLPVSFLADESQTPRPNVPGLGAPEDTKIAVDYPEGSDVGYRWLAAKGLKPLFPFGHGLSYTQFAHSGLKVSGGRKVTASFTVRNSGARDGADVPQLYLVDAAGKTVQRLVGFHKARLAPGESRTLSVAVDPRLLASWDKAANGWRIRGGDYRFALAKSAGELGETATVRLPARFLTDAQAAAEAPR